MKYGVLSERVKAIVYQKYLYWNEIYPKLGETHMRLALEREFIYARKYPFIEYGVDLQVMGKIENGQQAVIISKSPYDTNPPKEA
mmetsp:Transcript_6785/g.11410  ORF Transcript_6785/g.11410 Transcript_6785/m.11410 type:complete len:85 (+) Transcript_6785:966-1220(+)